MRVAADVEVTVRSWQPGREANVVATATARSSTPDSSAPPRKLTVTRANLFPAEAQALAQKIAAQEAQREFTLSASRPADLLLTPRSIIRTTGLGAWDGLWRPLSITRDFSRHSGFSMQFTARTTLDRVVG